MDIFCENEIIEFYTEMKIKRRRHNFLKFCLKATLENNHKEKTNTFFFFDDINRQ